MMKYLVLLGLFFFGTALAEKKSFGTDFQAENIVSLETAFTQSGSKEQVVKAKVGKVCEKKGCWMTLENSTGDLRVTFKDYKFFVPLSLMGKDVLVKGIFKKHMMSVSEAKHFAEDAGKDPSKVTAAKVEYRMIASGVKLL